MTHDYKRNGTTTLFAAMNVLDGTVIGRLMAAWRSATDRNTPRLRRRLVRMAKKPSTALSHEAEVGVKWNVHRGWRANHRRTVGCLWAATHWKGFEWAL
jgi:hypothetical protein